MNLKLWAQEERRKSRPSREIEALGSSNRRVDSEGNFEYLARHRRRELVVGSTAIDHQGQLDFGAS